MNRKTIFATTVILLAVFSASAFAQKKGRSAPTKRKVKTHVKNVVKSHGGHQLGSGQHHFNKGRKHNVNFTVHTGNRYRHTNYFHHGKGYGYSVHGRWNHYGPKYHHQFYRKYVNAQHHFKVRSNLYLVKFHQFPYDVCWHNGKYWVCFEGHWMPYSYLINNHAGAWDWHQTHYRFHNHAAFKKNWKAGNVRLIYGK